MVLGTQLTYKELFPTVGELKNRAITTIGGLVFGLAPTLLRVLVELKDSDLLRASCQLRLRMSLLMAPGKTKLREKDGMRKRQK